MHAYQGNFTCNHIFREANQVADVLAKQAIMALIPFQVFDFPPQCSINALRANVAHVRFPRGF